MGEAARGVIERLLGKEMARYFVIESIGREGDKDVFELQSDGDSIVIRGSGENAAASGFYWYLKHLCHCHISWCGERIDLRQPLPKVPDRVRISTPYVHRYYLNYCTFSYSMAFWDWERWEREIDWMALNGINLALSLVGQEEVTRRTLRRMGYSEQECLSYLSGPAFFPWQWMQNMHSWGGPLPEWWFQDRVELALKIHKRMLSLGIMPVLQGFSGAVPPDINQKVPESSPVEQGMWCSFDRPSLLLPNDPLYPTMSSIFYEEQQKLFGTDIHYYSMDPFHEGGSTTGINLKEYARGAQETLLRSDPHGVWVLQQWGDNPKGEILDGLNKEHALILDLFCESSPAWKKREAFSGVPWVWCMIQNFGGKHGLNGNLQTLAKEPLTALHDPASGHMAGIGLAMEGIETNPVLYDLMTDMIWRDEAPRLEEWLAGYTRRRYGKLLPEAMEAWSCLQRSVYNCSVPDQQGTMESLVCARPAAVVKNVSTWGPTESYYDPQDIRNASRLLFACYDQLKDSEGYLYDLVDVTRQALTDRSREYHLEMMAAYNKRDVPEFVERAGRFLQLILALDRLLGTRKEFLLGRWLAQAQNLGRSEADRDLFEWNARTLITLWGPEKPAESLRDYAHREWSGLVSDFYYRRWEMYIHTLKEALDTGSEPAEIDWYAWEYAWTQDRSFIPNEPQGDLCAILSDIVTRYY